MTEVTVKEMKNSFNRSIGISSDFVIDVVSKLIIETEDMDHQNEKLVNIVDGTATILEKHSWTKTNTPHKRMFCNKHENSVLFCLCQLVLLKPFLLRESLI